MLLKKIKKNKKITISKYQNKKINRYQHFLTAFVRKFL